MTDIKIFPRQRYSQGAIGFHWSMAVLIAVAGIIGLLFDDMPKEWKGPMINLHSALGCLILLLFAGRVWWRRTHLPPPLPGKTSDMTRKLTGIGHVALYVLMGLVPAIGLVYLVARGRGIDFYLFQLPVLMERTPALARPLGNLHSLSAYALLVLATGHILFALLHQFVWKDGSLARMLPEGKRNGTAAVSGNKAA